MNADGDFSVSMVFFLMGLPWDIPLGVHLNVCGQ